MVRWLRVAVTSLGLFDKDRLNVLLSMPHINDLYGEVETGVTAHLYPPEDAVGAA